MTVNFKGKKNINRNNILSDEGREIWFHMAFLIFDIKILGWQTILDNHASL
jgi:hypothetical protein